jgi:hypothetical protein
MYCMLDTVQGFTYNVLPLESESMRFWLKYEASHLPTGDQIR